MKKKLIALLLSATMVASLAACGGSGSTTTTTAAPETTTAAPETTTAAETTTGAETTTAEETTEAETVEPKGTIKVGHLVDLSGVEKVTGDIASESFAFACEYIEKTTGWSFDVVELDVQGDSDKAAAMAEQMLSQGCKAIFGPTQIGHKKSVLAFAADNPIPVVLYNGSPAAFTGGALFANDNIIALGGGTAGFPTVMADYLYNDLGLRKVYCFKQETVGGNNYVDPFVTCFEAMGGEVIDNIAVAQGTNDWSAYLTTIMNSDAEAIVGWTSSSDAIAFYKEWYNSGAYEKLPVYGTMHGGFSDSYILDNLDAEVADALVEQGLTAPICYCYGVDNEYNETYVDAWVAEKGELPYGNNLAGSCCQALLCLVEAVESVGADADCATLVSAMRAAEFDGPEGHTVFEEGSCVATKDTYVVQAVKLDDGTYNYEIKKVYEQVAPEGYHYTADGQYVAE